MLLFIIIISKAVNSRIPEFQKKIISQLNNRFYFRFCYFSFLKPMHIIVYPCDTYVI